MLHFNMLKYIKQLTDSLRTLASEGVTSVSSIVKRTRDLHLTVPYYNPEQLLTIISHCESILTVINQRLKFNFCFGVKSSFWTFFF